MADLTSEEQRRLIEATIRMVNSGPPTIEQLSRPIHCLKEPEIDIAISDVQEQRKRRWAIVLLVAGSLLTLGGGLVTVALWAGDLQATTEQHSVETRAHREDIRQLRRDLLDVERANGERVGRIETAVGRLEQRVEDLSETTKARPHVSRRRDGE